MIDIRAWRHAWMRSRGLRIGEHVDRTPFPISPMEVAPLSQEEFACDLGEPDPSLDAICLRFANDTNRALVWLIRFRALRAWWAREDMPGWLSEGSRTLRDVYEVAAAFELNDRWEFEHDAFSFAVDCVVHRRGNSR
jgi:hypothetical protein